MNVDRRDPDVFPTAAVVDEESDVLRGACGTQVAAVTKGLLDLERGLEPVKVRVESHAGQFLVFRVASDLGNSFKLALGKSAKIVWILRKQARELSPLVLYR